MLEESVNVEDFISKKLHSLLFLEEFVFARNKFSPPSSSEIELADAVVMLGDVLLIYQIKERPPSQAGDEGAERTWFKSKVLGKATKQIRDTLSHLQTYPEIRVPNERGHVFNLGGRTAAEIIKIIVYMPSRNLPTDCRSIRHYVSSTGGFIHIVNAQDYLEVSRMLRVPQEVVRYFQYREMVLTRFSDACSSVPEPAIAGHFIGGDPDTPPNIASAMYLHRLIQDEQEWDLSPFLRRLHDHLSVPEIGNDYYQILIEFAKLPRSMWREVRKRILKCIEKVEKDEFARPYRLTVRDTDCGFVFVPVDSQISQRPDWKTVRVGAIQNFTVAHKYDQRLSKCIGILVAKDGRHFDIHWCLIAQPWVENPALQQELDRNFPFRPVREAQVHGYRFMDNNSAISLDGMD